MDAKVVNKPTLIRKVVEDIAAAEQYLDSAVNGLGQLAFNLRDHQNGIHAFGNRLLDIIGETPTVIQETAELKQVEADVTAMAKKLAPVNDG